MNSIGLNPSSSHRLPTMPVMQTIPPCRAQRSESRSVGADAPIVPTRGLRFSSAFRWIFQAPGARSGFPLTELQLAAFKPIGKRGIGFLAGNGGSTLGRDAPPVLQFTLGGPLTLGAYGLDEFRGSNYILGRLGYLQRSSKAISSPTGS